MGDALGRLAYGRSVAHAQDPLLLDGENHRVQGLLAAVGIDLELGLRLADGVEEPLEVLVGEVSTGKNREVVAFLLILHAVDDPHRDVDDVRADSTAAWQVVQALAAASAAMRMLPLLGSTITASALASSMAAKMSAVEGFIVCPP